MKRCVTILLLLPALTPGFLPAQGEGRGKNLVPNGDFEKGKKGCPLGWDRPDGLTSFWVKDPLRPGRCMRFDTDVYKWEYYKRREEMKLPHPPPPRPKTPTKGRKFNTVAGVTGVPFFSGFFPIDPRLPYKLTLEFMPGRPGLGRKKLVPKVFVKGYIRMTREIWENGKTVKRSLDRVAFKIYKDLKGGVPGKWKKYTLYFFPGRRNPSIRRLKVMLFPYWPPGEYFFDNVRVEPMERKKWEKERALLLELERREAAGKGKIVPGRGAGNVPSRRQRKQGKKKKNREKKS